MDGHHERGGGAAGAQSGIQRRGRAEAGQLEAGRPHPLWVAAGCSAPTLPGPHGPGHKSALHDARQPHQAAEMNCRHGGVVQGAAGEDDGQEGHRVSTHLCREVRTYQPSHSGSVPQAAGEHAPGDLFLLRACLSPVEFKTTFKSCTRMSLKEQRFLARLMLLPEQSGKAPKREGSAP